MTKISSSVLIHRFVNATHLAHLTPSHPGRVVRVLVKKYPPSITELDENGNTALHLAALHGRTDVANFLIDEGAEVEARWVTLVNL